MRLQLRLADTYPLSICLLAFSIPFPFLLATICIWVIALSWLVTGGAGALKDSWRGIPAYWIWILFFLLHAIGWFYCKDKSQSLFDTTSKLPFMLMPLLIGGGKAITRAWWSAVFASFIAGVAITALICFIQAAALWSGDHQTGHFFYHELVHSFDANAVYMSWYVITALCLLLFYGFTGLSDSRIRLLRIILLSLLTAFFIALSCRLLLVVFLLIILPLYILKGQLRLSRILKTSVLSLLAVGVLGLAFIQNPIRQRFEDLFRRDARQAFLADYHGKPQPDGNLTVRLFMWRVAVDNLQSHHLWLRGSGNGDSHLLTNQRIDELGIWGMNEETHNASNFYNINLHNMYFQSLLMLGIPGLLLFLLIVFLPFFSVSKAPDRLLWRCFHLCSALFFLQEAALQTQAGIVFYSLFSALFWKLVNSGIFRNSLSPALQDY